MIYKSLCNWVDFVCVRARVCVCVCVCVKALLIPVFTTGDICMVDANNDIAAIRV